MLTFNLQLVGEKEAGEDVRPLDSSGYLAIPPSAAEGDTNSQEGNQQSFITYQDHVGGMNTGTAFCPLPVHFKLNFGPLPATFWSTSSPFLDHFWISSDPLLIHF